VLREAMITRAPAPASKRAASRPMPLFAPVISAVRPCWSGISFVLAGIRSLSIGSATIMGIKQRHNARLLRIDAALEREAKRQTIKK
jgi:hypothetical protein